MATMLKEYKYALQRMQVGSWMYITEKN